MKTHINNLEHALNVAELEQDLAEQQRKMEKVDKNLPIISESMVDFMLKNTPKLPS